MHNRPFNPGPVQGASTVLPTSVSFHITLNPVYFTGIELQYRSSNVIKLLSYHQCDH